MQEVTNSFLTPTQFGVGGLDNSNAGDMVAVVQHWLVSNSILGDAA